MGSFRTAAVIGWAMGSFRTAAGADGAGRGAGRGGGLRGAHRPAQRRRRRADRIPRRRAHAHAQDAHHPAHRLQPHRRYLSQVSLPANNPLAHVCVVALIGIK